MAICWSSLLLSQSVVTWVFFYLWKPRKFQVTATGPEGAAWNCIREGQGLGIRKRLFTRRQYEWNSFSTAVVTAPSVGVQGLFEQCSPTFESLSDLNHSVIFIGPFQLEICQFTVESLFSNFTCQVAQILVLLIGRKDKSWDTENNHKSLYLS